MLSHTISLMYLLSQWQCFSALQVNHVGQVVSLLQGSLFPEDLLMQVLSVLLLFDSFDVTSNSTKNNTTLLIEYIFNFDICLKAAAYDSIISSFFLHSTEFLCSLLYSLKVSVSNLHLFQVIFLWLCKLQLFSMFLCNICHSCRAPSIYFIA